MAQVTLVELIDEVAAQLLEAEERAATRADRVMQFAECDLELAISVETGGKGGLKIWVIELGGDRTKTNTNTIKVKFKARPQHIVAVPAALEGEGPELGPSSRNS
jgi:hypothetical protein